MRTTKCKLKAREVKKPKPKRTMVIRKIKQASKWNSHVYNCQTIGLAIVPVKVRAIGSERIVQTYAFLDGGSNTSFCSENLMRQLNIKGKKTTLSLTTLEKANN